MKEQIQREAVRLGFDLCRVTSAESPSSYAHFEKWVASGWHGEMGYLARNLHKRANPREILPGARSIIVLATSYAPPAAAAPVEAPAAPAGVVARYARYADYHEVLGERLAELAGFMGVLGGDEARSLWYVDTGPILERDLAQRAGIGFVGKHTSLISRRLGNWFFISEILTTLPLEPDVPEVNRCGSCARCLAACPTEAIVRPFELDSRRCISYLTIELKGPIPEEMRPLIGNRIFGCDDCLQACPWNRFARAGRAMLPHARADLANPDLFGLLRLDEAGFRERFRGTPMQRSKRKGLLRNVCVALGNVAGPEALPALSRAAEDPEPLIAEHARWAVRQIRRRAGLAPDRD